MGHEGAYQEYEVDYINRLKDAVDSLWGEIPTDNVKFLQEHRPDLVELCHQIHEELWHG